ncbi:MAG: hypothetical protein QNJ51_03100 [Calothrix sp. MO_167.B12]|nr:hypothetical protein [Calothrix sp. MO_167.B12]
MNCSKQYLVVVGQIYGMLSISRGMEFQFVKGYLNTNYPYFEVPLLYTNSIILMTNYCANNPTAVITKKNRVICGNAAFVVCNAEHPLQISGMSRRLAEEQCDVIEMFEWGKHEQLI